MKILKAIFAVCFLLFSVTMVNAQSVQWSEEEMPSCSASNDFNMQIMAEPSITGQCCFNVTVNYSPSYPKGVIVIPEEIFISDYAGVVVTSSDASLTTLICYSANAPSESVIACGVLNPEGAERCRDGCTVIIEPCKLVGD